MQQAMGNVAFHRRAVVEVRALLAKRDAAAAEAALLALQAKWDGTSLDSPMVAPLKRQLTALAEEVDDPFAISRLASDLLSLSALKQLDELPRSHIGKILKTALREMVSET